MYNSMWYQLLNKSLLTPPSFVFSIVWPILYVMMGISLYLFLQHGLNKEKRFILWIFVIQLILNLLWSPVFFVWQNIVLAFIIIIVLIILVLINIILFSKYSKPSAVLLIPYLFWLMFAGYLNFEIIRLN